MRATVTAAILPRLIKSLSSKDHEEKDNGFQSRADMLYSRLVEKKIEKMHRRSHIDSKSFDLAWIWIVILDSEGKE